MKVFGGHEIGVFIAFLAACAAPPSLAQSNARWQSGAPVPASTPTKRVTADLKRDVGTWTGVRSCDEADRARKAFSRVYDRWLGKQVRANGDKQLGRFGYRLGAVWTENRTRSGVRSCKAGYNSAAAFVDFH